MARSIGIDELLTFLKEHSKERFLLTFHSMGDRDSVGSAVGLQSYLQNSIISTPDSITSTSKHLLSSLSQKIDLGTSIPKDVYGVIVLDANNTDALGKFGKEIAEIKKPVLFIDHHLNPRPSSDGFLIFNKEDHNSTASLIYELLKRLDNPPGKDAALALLSGIVADSFEFHNMYPQTFRQVSELLVIARTGYPQFMDQFNEKVSPYSKRQAIKDICSAKIEIMGDYLVVHGQASMQAKIPAETAIKMGADAAIFWTENNNEASISGRLRPPLDSALSVNLGVIMRDAAPILGGQGGGHPAAAGAYGPNKASVQKAMDKILKELKDKLQGQ